MLGAVSTWLDYVFYRTSLFYKSESRLSSAIVIAVIQTLAIVDLCIFVLYILKLVDYVCTDARVIDELPGALFIVLILINQRYYRNKSEAFDIRWKDEPKKERDLRGLFVILTFIVPFIPLIIKIIV